ncbi:hypothetical protein ACLOJK_030852 [Asimina triloba]
MGSSPFPCMKVHIFETCCHFLSRVCRYLAVRSSPFRIQFSYFVSVSLIGFFVLKILSPKKDTYRPRDLDVFFMSVSATTVSSMGTVEMEVFSNAQLVVFVLLMLVGGEVFTSMLGLQFMKTKLKRCDDGAKPKDDFVGGELPAAAEFSLDSNGRIQMEMTAMPDVENPASAVGFINQFMGGSEELKYSCVRYLGFVVLGFLLVTQAVGSVAVLVYLSVITSARDVVKKKGINVVIFSIFTSISTFTNCGFIPTNENMMIFKKNSGLLLLLIPLILSGNTLFAPCLRLLIWVLRKFVKGAKFESEYMLKNPKEIPYEYLLPSYYCMRLFLTVLSFIAVQLVLFCCLEWYSPELEGMSSYRKIVAALFQTVNSRHSGESSVNLAKLSPAILVLYAVMMYLPPQTAFLPTESRERSTHHRDEQNEQKGLLQSFMLSQLSYLAIFIILICITERKKMSEDPLNFNLLNITIEVVRQVSDFAYGNVGFSMGYSCELQLKPDGHCKDPFYGFSGRWSRQGKLILIVVMFFGRLKKFSRGGGKAWQLK